MRACIDIAQTLQALWCVVKSVGLIQLDRQRKMELSRPAIEETMPIHVITNLLNPASFPILCFNPEEKKEDIENREIKILEYFLRCLALSGLDI